MSPGEFNEFERAVLLDAEHAMQQRTYALMLPQYRQADHDRIVRARQLAKCMRLPDTIIGIAPTPWWRRIVQRFTRR